MIMAGKSITNFISSGYTLEQGLKIREYIKLKGTNHWHYNHHTFFAMLTQLQKLERKTQLPAALFFIKPLKAANNVRNHTFTIIIAILSSSWLTLMIRFSLEEDIIVIIIIVIFIIVIYADDEILTWRGHHHHHHCNFHQNLTHHCNFHYICW